MSGKIYRAFAPEPDDVLDTNSSDFVAQGDTHSGINISEQDGSSIYDQSIVAPVSTQRFSPPVIQPTDTNSRVQRLEFVLENQSIVVEQHGRMLHNANTLLNKHKAAIQTSYAVANSAISNIKVMHEVLIKMDSQVKSNSNDLRDISDIRLAAITKDLLGVMKQVETHHVVMRDQYEELKSAIDDAHSFIDDLNSVIASNTETIIECKEAITTLGGKMGAVIQLINNYTITKRIIIKIVLIVSAIVSSICTIYSSGILGKTVRWIASS